MMSVLSKILFCSFHFLLGIKSGGGSEALFLALCQSDHSGMLFDLCGVGSMALTGHAQAAEMASQTLSLVPLHRSTTALCRPFS
jgi:hypothetical protein